MVSWICVLNRALHKLPFKMLMHRRMIKCIQPQDWFAAIDLKEIAVLLAKDAIEPVPPAEMRQGFYSPYFIVPKKGGVLDLRLEPGFAQAPIQDADAQAHDQMHSAPGLVCSDRPEGRLLSLFDPSTTQTVSTVCVRRSGMAVQGPPLRALPVSPCVHEGCRGRPYPVTGSGRQDPQLYRRLAYPSPIQRAVGRSQGFGAPAPQPVGASGQLGKEQALPCAENLSLSSFRGRNVVPLKQFQRLLGHMPSAAAVTPLGLLHMRPLQHWLHSRVPMWAWRHGTLRVGISQQCRRTLSPWTDLAFLQAGVPLEQVFRHTVVTTDASSTGWGATCNGQAASGLWTGPDCFGTSTAWSCGQCI